MELRSKIQDFAAAGIDVFSLSYDEPGALADFRDAYDITYTLLSDPNSNVIRQFGILNTLIGEDASGHLFNVAAGLENQIRRPLRKQR